MTIAIPLFGERVSPHFSTAPELLVALAQGRAIFSLMRFPLATASLSEKKNKILSLGVNTLVCGGIDKATRRWLQKRGIRVIANLLGEAENVLSNILEEGEMHFGQIKSAIMNLNDQDRKRLIIEVVPAIWLTVCADEACVACLRGLVDETMIKE